MVGTPSHRNVAKPEEQVIHQSGGKYGGKEENTRRLNNNTNWLR
ncbi:hypothetical protein PI125_g15648 [Phytophthora idaei]|nr:hypothetical protein PI125_g15648 [Phytophthora idaei]KAG3143398.1 hypothetical protein PI126_g14636 [Phytophthora idaei]